MDGIAGDSGAVVAEMAVAGLDAVVGVPPAEEARQRARGSAEECEATSAPRGRPIESGAGRTPRTARTKGMMI